MRTKSLAVVVVLAAVTGLTMANRIQAADEKKTDAGKAMKITYDDHVKPIFREKCFACHNTDKKVGGLDLSSFISMMEGGASGTAIEPGSPDDSYLWLLVNHDIEPYMPPKADKLPAESLKTIRDWIEAGALENSGSVAKIKKKTVDLGLTGAPSGKPEGPAAMPRGLLIDPVVRPERTTAVTAMATSPWAPLVAIAAPRQVILYQSQTLEILGVLPFPEGEAKVLKFSRNGELLLAGGGRGAHSGKAIVWNVRSGERVIEVGDELDSVLAADISADQSLIALGGPNRIVRVYSTSTGEKLYEIKKHTEWIYALEFSPDGVLLATGDRNGGMFVWEAYTGRLYGECKGHKDAVTDISWRLDSNIVASCSEDTSIKLWELENCNQVKTWNAHAGGVLSVEFARDGRIASCGRDKVAKLWDGNGAQKIAFPAFGDLALATTIADESDTVVASDWTGAVKVWSAADGKPLGDLSPNPLTVAERLAAASQQLTASKTAADQQAAALAALQKQITDMQQELQTQKATAETSAKQMAAETQAIATYQKSIAALDAQIQAEQATQATLAKVIPLLQESFKNAQAAADAAKDDKALTESAGAVKGLLDSRVQSMNASQAAMKAASEKKASEATALAAAQKNLAGATQAKAAADKRVAELEPAVKAASEKLPAAQQAAAESATALANAQGEVDRLKTYEELKAQYAVLKAQETQLLELQAALETAEQSMKTVQQATTEIQTQLGERQKGLEAATAGQKAAEETIADARKKMEAEQAMIATLEKLLPALKDAHQKTEAAKAAVGEDADVVAALNGLQAALTKRQQELAARQKTMEAEAARMKAAEVEMAKAVEQAKAMQAAVTEMTAQMTAKQAELDEARKQQTVVAAQVAEAESKLENIRKVVDELRDRVTPGLEADAQASR